VFLGQILRREEFLLHGRSDELAVDASPWPLTKRLTVKLFEQEIILGSEVVGYKSDGKLLYSFDLILERYLMRISCHYRLNRCLVELFVASWCFSIGVR
jgi:hypothetical protein